MRLKAGQILFKRQLLNEWRITDQDGTRHMNADQAFALMQELVEDGWRLIVQENYDKSVRAVLMEGR